MGMDLVSATSVADLEVTTLPGVLPSPFKPARPWPQRRILLPRRMLVVLAAVLGVLMAGGAHGFLSSTHHGIGSPTTTATAAHAGAAVAVQDAAPRTLTATATAASQGGVGHDGQSGAHKHHMEEQGNRRSPVSAATVLVRSARRVNRRVLLPRSRRWRPALARGPPRWVTYAAARTRIRLHLRHCVFVV